MNKQEREMKELETKLKESKIARDDQYRRLLYEADKIIGQLMYLLQQNDAGQ
jgi:hypothetical protein